MFYLRALNFFYIYEYFYLKFRDVIKRDNFEALITNMMMKIPVNFIFKKKKLPAVPNRWIFRFPPNFPYLRILTRLLRI